MDANHRDMVKFNSNNNHTYTTVRKMLQEFVLDAPSVVQRRYSKPPKVYQRSVLMSTRSATIISY